MSSYFFPSTNLFNHAINCSQTDVKYAIEQFTKAYLRGPSLYLQPETTDNDRCYDKNYDSDEEWVPFESEEENENEMDHMLDEEFLLVDQSDADIVMECDENEEAWVVKPTDCPTPLFDSTFPVLTENEEFYKLSDDAFIVLVKEVMNNSFQCDISFGEKCEKTLKFAMLRYILVECRKD